MDSGDITCSHLFYSICIPDCMIGRYRTVHNRVICVAQKAKDYNGNNSSISNSVPKYQWSGKTVKAVPYVFEVPEQVFHFVSLLFNPF